MHYRSDNTVPLQLSVFFVSVSFFGWVGVGLGGGGEEMWNNSLFSCDFAVASPSK